MPDSKKRGRPAAYTPEIGRYICDVIAQTELGISDISKRVSKKFKVSISKSAIIKWAANPEKYEEFVKWYDAAYKVRANMWVEERNELSLVEVNIPTPADVIEKYSIPKDPKTGLHVVPMVNKMIDQEIKKQENAIKRRLEILTKNIGQIASMYDRRYTNKYNQEDKDKGKVQGVAFVMNSFSAPIQNIPKDIEGIEVRPLSEGDLNNE